MTFDHHDPEVEAMMERRARVAEAAHRATHPLPNMSRAKLLQQQQALDPTSILDDPIEDQPTLTTVSPSWMWPASPAEPTVTFTVDTSDFDFLLNLLAPPSPWPYAPRLTFDPLPYIQPPT